jgi:hypothetical protein
MKLYEIAHSRAGDKGNISTLSLIPFKEQDYEWLCQVVTVEKVQAHFKGIILGKILRYEMPNIAALLFVCHDALAGGVTTSLAMDAHGKTFSSVLLEMEISSSSKQATNGTNSHEGSVDS